MSQIIDISVEYGFSGNYFSIMKSTTREKYDFIFGLDEDMRKAIQKYVSYVEKLIDEMRVILASYEKRSDYGKLLEKKKLTKCENVCSVWHSDDKTVDKLRFEDGHFLGVKFFTIKRWEKIIKLHKKIINNENK